MPTTLLPVDPAVSPQRVNRILHISASLLPEEVNAARRARRALVWVAVVVLLVTVLLGAWFVVAYQDKKDAADDLDAASVTVSDLQRQQRTYAKTVQVQNEITALTAQLKTVMANDLDWSALLDTVRNAGTPVGIEVDGVTGRLAGADGAAATQTSTLPGTSTATTVASLVVTGTGPDKRAVAAYVDALAKQTTLSNPYVTSVATEKNKKLTFSLTVDVTQTALCGRFTVECKDGGN